MNILLGVSGGIAAYKSAELLRLLIKEGFNVRVVMTESAQSFVTPLTFQVLSGYRVYIDLFSLESDGHIDHIALARWADFILIAPASANFIARFTHGLADDLLTTLCLATKSPVAIAPAMNQQMWLHTATQENLETLKKRGILCFGPEEGRQACGEFGPGRLVDPVVLLDLVKAQFHLSTLLGQKILITAGPTREVIDPVRYLTNRSSGIMGHCLAEAAMRAGAQVTLISSTMSSTQDDRITVFPGIIRFFVDSAQEMFHAVMSCVDDVDIFIAAAAVSDYKLESAFPKKIKKNSSTLTLKLIRTPDILSEVTKKSAPPFTVGFCAETDDLISNASKKLTEKNLDMIVANYVGLERGFGDRETEATILYRNKKWKRLPVQKKTSLAKQLMSCIAESYVSHHR